MSDFWVFGYGSLVWRPGIPFAENRPATVHGWTRRFWQGSTDHRGVPGAPGRVVTLVREPGSVCWGRAFRLDGRHRHGVMDYLDHREKGGYSLQEVNLRLMDDGTRVQGLVYVAMPQNPNWLGEAPLDEIAEQVRQSKGPSGPNREYVIALAEALRSMGAEDAHVFALEMRLVDERRVNRSGNS